MLFLQKLKKIQNKIQVRDNYAKAISLIPPQKKREECAQERESDKVEAKEDGPKHSRYFHPSDCRRVSGKKSIKFSPGF